VNAGFEPIPPKSTGSNVIHAEIIKQLSSCELVLCDMSILNPNVFFEFGIRTAIDKPVALVVDDKTKDIPFDTGIVNFYKYDSALNTWAIDKQIQELTKHVKDSYQKNKDHNAIWKYFGVAQTGIFKPEDVELGDKIDLIMNKLAALEREHYELKQNPYTIYEQQLTPNPNIHIGYNPYPKMTFGQQPNTNISIGPQAAYIPPVNSDLSGVSQSPNIEIKEVTKNPKVEHQEKEIKNEKDKSNESSSDNQ
jgi:hypothetical protein